MDKRLIISFKNMLKQQGFDFPYEIMRYILAKASYKVVKKLYFTCKYFPEKYRLFLIDINMGNRVIFKNSSKIFSYSDVTLLNVKIWLGDTFNGNVLLWMPKIKKCTIKKLCLSFEDIAWNDFKIFAKAETIEEIHISKVLDSDGKMVALEDICAFIPNAVEINFDKTHVTPNTMKEMCKMHNPASKITGFNLSYVDGPLNVNDYLKFIQEHVYRSGSRLLTDFISTVPKENLEKLRKAASYEVNEWPRPRTRCWFISRPD